MRLKHIIRRGNRFNFVCRVPFDLLHLFPTPTIWKSIKAENSKNARLMGNALEYRTQKLFMQLRTGMLDKELEKRLVAEYMQIGLKSLESIAYKQPLQGEGKWGDVTNECYSKINDNFKKTQQMIECSDAERRELESLFFDDFANEIRANIAEGNTSLVDGAVKAFSRKALKLYSIKMTQKDAKRLAIQLLNAEKKINDAENALRRGEFSLFEELQEKTEKDLEKHYYLFKAVLEKYKVHYLASKVRVKSGTIKDMEVECRILLEIIGNINIADVNSVDTLTKLKRVLLKYPKNKVQRYGDKSIHSIIKAGNEYETISHKTANEYIKRLKAVIDYANKSKMLNAANVAQNELFFTDTAEEDQRSAYDTDDMKRLINALCTKPLYTFDPPRPERFWIILIALFHGFRLGNIVTLSKRDVCLTDKDQIVFVLRHGKTKNTVRVVEICDYLLLLGFIDWIEKLPRENLFQDSADSFSKWYNRNETRKDGYTSKGFEALHVTTDKKKCLYSLRHNFAGNVFNVTDDYKITADMMGHSTGNSVTSRYTKKTRAAKLKEVTEKMEFEYIDFDLLEVRAKELFDL